MFLNFGDHYSRIELQKKARCSRLPSIVFSSTALNGIIKNCAAAHMYLLIFTKSKLSKPGIETMSEPHIMYRIPHQTAGRRHVAFFKLALSYASPCDIWSYTQNQILK
jgi:hypothetical protein